MAMSVPTGELQVLPEESSPGREQNVEQPGSFGGGPRQEQLTGAAMKASQDAGEIAAFEKNRADQIVDIENRNKLSVIHTNAMFGYDGPDGTHVPGFAERRGKDAAGAVNDTMDYAQKQVAQLAEGIQNQKQRASFMAASTSMLDELNRGAHAHALSEMEKYDGEQTHANVANETNFAVLHYGDKDAVALHSFNAIKAIKDYAGRNGMSPEWIDQQTAKTMDNIHYGVFNQMMTNGQDIAAGHYLDANKADINDPKILMKMQDTLSEGNTRREAQGTADSLFLKYPDNEKEALGAVDKIEDPDIRKQATQMLASHYTHIRQATKNDQDSTFQDSFKKISQSGETNPAIVRNMISPSDWIAMGPKNQTAILKLANNNRAQNNDKWVDFQNLARDPNELSQISQTDLQTKYLANFDAKHADEAIKQWQGASKGIDSATIDTKILQSYIAENKVIDGYHAGQKLSGAQADAYGKFYSEAKDATVQWQQANKTKATPEQMQKIFDSVAKKQNFSTSNQSQSDQWPSLGAITSNIGMSRVIGKQTLGLPPEKNPDLRVPITSIPQRAVDVYKSETEKMGAQWSNDKAERAEAVYRATHDWNKVRQVLAK